MTLHDRMESLADLLIAGGLSAEEKAEAERHAAECPACATLVRDAREFAAWTKGLIKSDAPPADLEDRVIERFRAAGQTKKRRFIVGKRVLKVTGSIAAAVGLIFLGNMFSLHDAAEVSVVEARDLSLKGITSAEADFRANDRDWNHVNDFWTSDVKGLYTMTTAAVNGKDGASNFYLEDPTSTAKAPAHVFRKMPSLGGDTTASMLGGSRSVTVEGKAVGGKEGEALSKNWGLGLHADASKLALYDVGDLTYGMASAPGRGGQLAQDKIIQERLAEPQHQLRRSPESGGEELRVGKSTEIPDADTTTNSLVVRALGLNREQKDATGEVLKLEMEVLPKPVKPTNPAQDNRKIIRNADVSLEVDSYDATYTKLAELAAAEKGFVASANTQKMANGKIQATVVVRIPPDRFEAVIARFKELGTIRHQNIGSEDVTKVYIDLESRLGSKQTLAARLSKLLAEGKGTVKELMEVEVQLGSTNEAIESIKGEIKYYDNRIGLSTITLQIAEKDLGQPFEYVQTLQANLALTVRDPDDAYAKAQKEIVDAGGQVVDSRMNRQSDGSSTGTIRGRVDADKFQALRDALKKLGVATNDTVNQQKTAHGGQEGSPKVDAPLRKEQAILDLSVTSPPIFVTRRSQLLIETSEVESAYMMSRKAVEGAGGKIVDGSLSGRTERMAAVLRVQIDADKFAALVESLKTAGKVKNAAVNSVLPTTAADGGAALLRERAEIELNLISPPQLIADENGIGKTIRDTFANSWAGVLWSVEKLFVGLSLAGPWLLVLAVGVALWRRRSKKKPA